MRRVASGKRAICREALKERNSCVDISHFQCSVRNYSFYPRGDAFRCASRLPLAFIFRALGAGILALAFIFRAFGAGILAPGFHILRLWREALATFCAKTCANAQNAQGANRCRVSLHCALRENL